MTQDAKAAVRKQFFTARKELGDTERQRQSEVLRHQLASWYRGHTAGHGGKVAMTIRFGTEPDTDALMHLWHADGVEIWVPISNADRSMSWTRWAPDVEMARSELGPIQEPTGPRFGPDAVADADLIIVPALAADTAGYRMGKGGGYYDRFLAALPQLTQQLPRLITPVFDHEFFPAEQQAFPIDDHDLPVHAVVTAATGLTWV